MPAFPKAPSSTPCARTPSSAACSTRPRRRACSSPSTTVRHWQSLQINLPRSPVHDLVVKGDDLVVATHGRSFWILDDITPLRQVAQASAATSAFLYAPQTGYRLYYPDEVDARPPVGQNPPSGVLVDYYLPAQTNGTLTIDILDAKGGEVRHLSSEKSKKAEQPPEWPDQVHPTDTLPGAAGHEPLCLEPALRRSRADPRRVLCRPGAARPHRAAGQVHDKAQLWRPKPNRAADHRGRSAGKGSADRTAAEDSRYRWRSITISTRCTAR